MTTNKRHVEIAQKIANDPYRLPHLASRDSLEHDIIQALASAERDAVERVKDVDPLEAECDWENSESVAYAVKELILKAIQAGKDEG